MRVISYSIGFAHAAGVELRHNGLSKQRIQPSRSMGPFSRVWCVVGRDGDEIDVAEAVGLAVERIGPIEEGLQLAADVIIVDRRSKDDGVCFLDLLDESLASSVMGQ